VCVWFVSTFLCFFHALPCIYDYIPELPWNPEVDLPWQSIESHGSVPIEWGSLLSRNALFIFYFSLFRCFRVIPVFVYIPEIPWKPEVEYRILFHREPGPIPHRRVSLCQCSDVCVWFFSTLLCFYHAFPCIYDYIPELPWNSEINLPWRSIESQGSVPIEWGSLLSRNALFILYFSLFRRLTIIPVFVYIPEVPRKPEEK